MYPAKYYPDKYYPANYYLHAGGPQTGTVIVVPSTAGDTGTVFSWFDLVQRHDKDFDRESRHPLVYLFPRPTRFERGFRDPGADGAIYAGALEPPPPEPDPELAGAVWISEDGQRGWITQDGTKTWVTEDYDG